jgi:hypothetical protein
MSEIKNIQIDAKIHKSLKIHCAENGLIIKTVLEKLIEEELKRVQKNEEISQKK